ncbi:MAG: anaerobic ribonucleoside-triphosphate reductase activating protein [Euryarchaeota archaeon]|nr:anaerobic ribonucleoside-triphosphate reductase activating protein [Euryarchaeota archaeon]
MTANNIIPLSTVDWYGRAATVVFLMGCPYRCPYCHNHALLEMGKISSEPADIEEIESEIKKNSLLISAVVFTGGECFQQFDALLHLAEFTHDHGLLVGVQTNGYYTGRIRQMIDAHLVDLICMDVKAPLTRDVYLTICGIDAASHVSDSLGLCGLCRENKIDFEARTTVFPDFIGSPQEIRSIAESIREIAGDVRYIIQQGIPEHAWKDVPERAYTRAELISLAKIARQFLSDVRIRTKESGEECV